MSETWKTIGKEEYIAHCENVGPHLEWSTFGSDSSFREAVLKDDTRVRESLSTAYLSWCHDGLGKICAFNNPLAKNFRVDEWINSRKVDLRMIERPDLPIEIIMSYDVSIDKPLILDGGNRSTAVVAFGMEQNKVSEILIFEARGKTIHEVFPHHFAAMVRNFSRPSS
jgi:hypothetical protein